MARSCGNSECVMSPVPRCGPHRRGVQAMHLTTTLGFIDVKGKAVQFARDAAPNIQLRDVVECEPELRYNTWVTDVVHYVSGAGWNRPARCQPRFTDSSKK